MKKTFFIILILFIVIGSLCLAFNTASAFGFSDISKFYGQSAQTAGLKPASATNYVAAIINALLLIVGAVFITLFIYGGIIWLTSAGNEDRIKKARQTLIYAVIGLIVVMGAYSISLAISRAITSAPQQTAGGDGVVADSCAAIGGVCKTSISCTNDFPQGTVRGVTEDCKPEICCILGIAGPSNCSACGVGTLNPCDATECARLGNCVFYKSPANPIGYCYNRGACNECGQGNFNRCDRAECLAIGCTYSAGQNPPCY